MTLRKRNMTPPAQWAILKLQAAIDDPDMPPDSLNPLDAIGIHAVLMALYNAMETPYDGLPFAGLRLDPSCKRMDVTLNDDSPQTNRLVERWIAAVSQLPHAPSGWTLNVSKVGGSLNFRHLELPDWRYVDD